MEALDLNSKSESWPNLSAYQEYLQSGGEDAGNDGSLAFPPPDPVLSTEHLAYVMRATLEAEAPFLDGVEDGRSLWLLVVSIALRTQGVLHVAVPCPCRLPDRSVVAQPVVAAVAVKMTIMRTTPVTKKIFASLRYNPQPYGGMFVFVPFFCPSQ